MAEIRTTSIHIYSLISFHSQFLSYWSIPICYSGVRCWYSPYCVQLHCLVVYVNISNSPRIFLRVNDFVFILFGVYIIWCYIIWCFIPTCYIFNLTNHHVPMKSVSSTGTHDHMSQARLEMKWVTIRPSLRKY